MAISRILLEEKLELLREKQIRQARHNLWNFCRVADDPEFYSHDSWHLKLNCWVLQALYERRLTKENFVQACKEIAPSWFMDVFDFSQLKDNHLYTKLMQNLPPRIGKSRTLVNFCKWVLGKDIKNKIITASYNDDMAQTFSRYTRDGIEEPKAFPHDINYMDVFPETKVKQGNASYKEWALEGNFFNYKGAGVGGSVTGKGCNISIVDDPVKDAEEAFNENRLEKIWTWYTGTFKSRKEQGGIEIVNMTRWAKGDICGRILDNEEEADQWFVFLLEAYYDEVDEYLCPALLNEETYKDLKRNVEPTIFAANYHQEPVDQKGRVYSSFKTYQDVPRDENGHPLFERIINYTDTADEGSDYLCSINAGVYQGEGYILDVYYTKDGMEITEPATADFLVNGQVNDSFIESNNGGKGFARNVLRIIWEKFQTKKVNIQWFHQSKNKKARILSNSTFVMNHLYFPVNWKDRWPQYYKAMTTYQKEGKNANDDAPDATTGIAELIASIKPKKKKKERKSSGRKVY
jgi:predicted phage terminase large subunit-like protein